MGGPVIGAVSALGTQLARKQKSNMLVSERQAMQVSFGQWLYLQSKGLAFLALLAVYGAGFGVFAIEAYTAGWFSDLGGSLQYARMVIAFVWAVL
jgi:hypothetical protein